MQGAEPSVPHQLRNEAFSIALLDPDQPVPEGVGKQSKSAPKRFSVYRNNVVVSLMEAMKAAYPSLLAIMGEENFAKVSRVYVANHPPASPLMQQYGRDFPMFLDAFKPLAKSPFLSDVALAEMKWLEAFHSRDEAFIEPDDMAGMDPEASMQLVFEPHPAAHLVRSRYPVFDFFNARHVWPQDSVDLAEPQTFLISRPGLECLATALNPAQSEFFTCLFEGRTLAEAIGAGMESDEAFDAAAAITIIFQTGIFTKPDTQQVRKSP